MPDTVHQQKEFSFSFSNPVFSGHDIPVIASAKSHVVPLHASSHMVSKVSRLTQPLDTDNESEVLLEIVSPMLNGSPTGLVLLRKR